MKSIRFITIIILIGFFSPLPSSAATGDIIKSCLFDGSGITPAQIVSGCGFGSHPMNTWSVVPQGGHDGRQALRGNYNKGDIDVFDGFWTGGLGSRREITVVYWERFDLDPSVSGGWNVKSIRAYSGDTFMGGMMSLWGGSQWQQGNSFQGLLTTTAAVTSVNTADGYCVKTGSNTYNCPNGRASVNWNPGFGTNWHKIRIYFKVPASGQSDGVTKVWIDENLVYTLSKMSGANLQSPYITNITFRPSDDFFSGYRDYGFGHYYDDVAVYEGYVPPNGTCSPAWVCDEWSICTNGTQNRACTDANNCGTTTNRPALTQTCTVTDPTATTITVDSTYLGYSKDKIDDDIKNASGMEAGTWASGDSSTNPHFIEFSFPQAKTLNYVDIYWAYNPSQSAYMSSQNLQVQYWSGSQYITAATIMNTGSTEKSQVSFTAVSTSKLRLYQPANKGNSAYPSVLWLTEVDYGQWIESSLKGDLNNDNSVNVTDLGILLGNWNTAACPEPCRGDLNQDGKVDVADLGILLGNWG